MAKVKIYNRRLVCGEEVADVEVEGGAKLEGVKVGKDKIPQLLDEIPALAVVACFAAGKTLIEGARELRIKETDRIRALCKELTRMGASVEEREDGMLICGGSRLKGTEVNSWADHLCAEGETIINNARCIDVSFPGFHKVLHEVATG